MFHLNIQAWFWRCSVKAGNKVFKKIILDFLFWLPSHFFYLWCQGSLWWSSVSIRHCLTTQIAPRNTFPNSQVCPTIESMIVEIFFKKNTTMSFSSQEVVSVHCVCQTYFFNRFYVWLSLLWSAYQCQYLSDLFLQLPLLCFITWKYLPVPKRPKVPTSKYLTFTKSIQMFWICLLIQSHTV